MSLKQNKTNPFMEHAIAMAIENDGERPFALWRHDLKFVPFLSAKFLWLIRIIGY